MSFHHLLLDAWSLQVLLRGVMFFYAGFCEGHEPKLEQVRPYRDYIAWLQQQDLGKAEVFWRQELQGFHTPANLGSAALATLAYVGAGWSLADAVYMVVLTVYTVGYGEVRPLHTLYLRTVTELLIVLGCTGMILLTGALVQLMHDHEVFGEIICPSALTPINLSPLIASVSNTRRLLTVEEGSTFGGLGAEVISQLLEQDIALRSIRRLGNGTILPCSAKAEARLLPSSRDIVQCILELMSK